MSRCGAPSKKVSEESGQRVVSGIRRSVLCQRNDEPREGLLLGPVDMMAKTSGKVTLLSNTTDG